MYKITSLMTSDDDHPIPDNTFFWQEENTDHLALILPGLNYTCDMPLLYYTAQFLIADGADVLQVKYDYTQTPQSKTQSLDEMVSSNKEIKRSLMTNLTYARSAPELMAKLKDRKTSQLEEKGIVVGEASQVIERLNQYKEVGCEEIMLQWIDLDDLDGLIDLSEKVLPEFQSEN